MTPGFSLTWSASVRCTGWLGRFRETPKNNLKKSQNKSCAHVARGYIAHMNETTKAKVERLHSIILANYTAAGNYDPAFAAKCAMELILKMAFGQPKYTDQLLDEEIEDNLKAGKAVAA